MVLKVLLPLEGKDPSYLGLFLVLFCVFSASYSSFSLKIRSEVHELCWCDAAYLDHQLWERDELCWIQS
jgi:hypothetical protein